MDAMRLNYHQIYQPKIAASQQDLEESADDDSYMFRSALEE